MKTIAKQQTIKNAVEISGKTLHLGQNITLILEPADDNLGIIFERTDCMPAVKIPAQVQWVSDTLLGTTLQKAQTKIATIEHLLSALSGLNIDNLHIKINGPEIPILDGSAALFVKEILASGLKSQTTSRQAIKIKEKILSHDQDKWIAIEPDEQFKITYILDYKHPFFQKNPQSFEITISPESYINHIAPSHTFGFLAEHQRLLSMNLAQGADLTNTLVIGEDCLLNPNLLRYPDEFARHKILDLIGDLYLCGHPIIGHVHAHKSGHSLNKKLVEQLLNNKTCWEWTTINLL